MTVDDYVVFIFVKVTVDDSVSTVGSMISESERTRIKEGVNTRIYVCATMWHETANEMVQVLKSIMRLVKSFDIIFLAIVIMEW